MKKACQEIKKALKNVKTAIIACHVDPDGDAIGSMLALGMVLEQVGITPSYYCADPVPKIYRFLNNADKVKREIASFQHFDVAFTVDASDVNRLGNKIDLRQHANFLINIDHHPDNTNYGDLNCVMKTSSVAEQIYDLAVSLKVNINKEIAECLYTSIITDTGNFRYDNTSARTLLIAAELIKHGVSTHELTTRIYDNRTIPSVKLSGRALANIKFSADHKLAWTVVTEEMMRETGAKGEDLVGIVDAIRSIEGVEVALVMRQDNGKIKINFRSKNKVNVSEIARRFGGGGHIKAAGAVVEGPIEKVEAQVIGEITKHLRALNYLV